MKSQKIRQLQHLVDELGQKALLYDQTNTQVSASSIGWHIEHTLLTINLIINALKASDPKDYQWQFSTFRLGVFLTGKIGRGRGKAPQSVQPRVTPDAETINKQLSLANQRLPELQSCSDNQFFTHPYFGKLNVQQTARFLIIHTRHHLAIINDIARSNH